MESNIRKFLLLQGALQKIDPAFPLQYAVCLAEIALDEGLSHSDLAERMGLGLPTVSRIVGALSRRRQKGATPYGLIRVAISESERRKREIYLTMRGRAVIGRIARILE
jgi:DNA-binding MarR family transcriptional regulator